LSDEPPSGPGPGSDDFDPKHHVWDGREWWTADHKFWWDGTRWQPQDAPRPETSPIAPVGKKRRPPGYWRDFWLGFLGVIVGNILLAIILNSVSSANVGEPVTGIVLAAPWVLNLAALIIAAIVRVPILLGMLLAYGIAFGLAILAGIFLLVLCYSGGGGVP